MFLKVIFSDALESRRESSYKIVSNKVEISITLYQTLFYIVKWEAINDSVT